MKKRKLSKGRIVENNSVEHNYFTKSKIGLFVVGGIILIMIVSVFAFSLGGGNDPNVEEIEYNGYEFVDNNGIWLVNINGVSYGFEYFPSEVETIESIDLSNEEFENKVYLIFNPDEFSENSLELIRLKQFLVSRGTLVSLACTKEENCGNIPIVDCNNINKGLYLKNSNKTFINKEGSCIVLEAMPAEETLVINKFMYKVLGVM